MNKILLFLSYGVVLPKTELFEVAQRHNTTDTYGLIYSHGLEYYPVGNQNYSSNLVVGTCRMVAMDYEALYLSDDLDIKSFRLTSEQELSTLHNLRELGITLTPSYLLFQSYIEEDVDGETPTSQG